MNKKRNFINLCVFLFMGIMIAACGGKKSPADIEMSIQNEYKKGNYKKAIDISIANTHFEDAETKKETQAMVAPMIEKAKQKNESKGGIANVELVSEDIDEEDGTATVKTLITYGDGSTKTERSYYEKVNGTWKIVLN